jgi:hypothetical protein
MENFKLITLVIDREMCTRFIGPCIVCSTPAKMLISLRPRIQGLWQEGLGLPGPWHLLPAGCGPGIIPTPRSSSALSLLVSASSSGWWRDSPGLAVSIYSIYGRVIS